MYSGHTYRQAHKNNFLYVILAPWALPWEKLVLCNKFLAQFVCLISCIIYNIYIWYPWYIIFCAGSMIHIVCVWGIHDTHYVCLVSIHDTQYILYVWITSLILCIVSHQIFPYVISRRSRNKGGLYITVTSRNQWLRPSYVLARDPSGWAPCQIWSRSVKKCDLSAVTHIYTHS